MSRNFGLPHIADPKDEWPIAVFAAVVVLIVLVGIFIA